MSTKKKIDFQNPMLILMHHPVLLIIFVCILLTEYLTNNQIIWGNIMRNVKYINIYFFLNLMELRLIFFLLLKIK